MSHERCPDCGQYVYPDTAGIPLSACHTCGIVADKAGALRRRDDLRKRLKDVEDAIEWYERREK